MVERGSGIAVWRQIGEQLAEDIRKKRYPAGEQMPPEPELAARFSVNRHTIRRAMAELEQHGLVRIEQGRGTFVQEHAIDYVIGRRTRFSENLRNQGLHGHVEVLDSLVLRNAEIARHLGLPRSHPLLRVQLIGKAEDTAINVSEHYFDERRFPGFADELAQQRSVSKVYARFGVGDYTRKWSRITAALPSAEVTRILGQPKTRPILQIESLNVDQAGVPLQYSLTRFVGDWVQLVISDETAVP
ncbi:phosphonate metabolism transcriptional regulator PhnF [Bordetella genomosp. 1]|uniref:Phosphonate metabolism transcriptional regulator PhnF n=1 Tax=Bordetella genomosp. 1 TaxID=1395607 RepID=A0A261SVQ6_9BORD|nr:phosphonate metabolism transcriptional regulator PhnF [Bordetella genomosp. 1]MDQ8033010.1 phosphonate metabolism transcriptional regulator PhnF [Bordetella sp.]OZI41072.1 phosphonate metabolism transcriptional regulator PhnF [Bordetella genomosp. 1]OZI69263.1 phosphonate metabolism transcriptional regulator PhnF [Bordetella genomosp. 1]